MFDEHCFSQSLQIPDSKVHGANMGPIWVLSAPDGPHVGPMNLAIRNAFEANVKDVAFLVKGQMHYRHSKFQREWAQWSLP